MPPRIPDPPRIIRQPGESDYSYRNRKSLAQYGQTLYERRKARGTARGLTVQEAGGHRNANGKTPYQQRRERSMERYGLTPSQLYRQNITAELEEAGFTPASTGWSWSRLIRAWPKIRQINEWSSQGGKLTPDMLSHASGLEQSGVLPRNWSWYMVQQKYADMLDYIEAGYVRGPDRTGYVHWHAKDASFVPVEWWYYH